ncbi:hypothetical protein GCM10010442_46600 [Kitasatospora kifunensis]
MSGLVMMLVTFTCAPPSWVAMLPQKFSAATTWITLEPAVEEDELVFAAEEVAQALAVARAATAAALSRMRAGCLRTVRGRTDRICRYSSESCEALWQGPPRLDGRTLVGNDFQNQPDRPPR